MIIDHIKRDICRRQAGLRLDGDLVVAQMFDGDLAGCDTAQIRISSKTDLLQRGEIKIAFKVIVADDGGIVGKAFDPFDVGSSLANCGLARQFETLGIDLQFKGAIGNIKVAERIGNCGIFDARSGCDLDIIKRQIL